MSPLDLIVWAFAVLVAVVFAFLVIAIALFTLELVKNGRGDS